MSAFKYQIGDTVYLARFTTHHEIWIECPDCFGTKSLLVTLANGESFNIPCSGCAPGYDPPTGKIKSYIPKAEAERRTIVGIETHSGKVEYHVSAIYGGGYYSVGESVLFDSQEPALEEANRLAEAHKLEMETAHERKEHPQRTWAWHVTHHRREMKRAERELKRHRNALGIATEKAKSKK